MNYKQPSPEWLKEMAAKEDEAGCISVGGLICEIEAKQTKKVGFIGMPAYMYLDIFGDLVFDAFGYVPYLVGSSTERADFRDVDVRMIVPDEEYKAMRIGDFNELRTNKRWAALCLAFSELGKKITGLPIDFQIQQMTFANRYEGKREPLGIKTQ